MSDKLEIRPAPTTLEELQGRVAAWQSGEPNALWLLAKAVKIGEEAGEVEGAILKYLEGRTPRSNIADELGDLMIAACGASALLGIDLMSVAGIRFAGDVEHRTTYSIGEPT